MYLRCDARHGMLLCGARNAEVAVSEVAIALVASNAEATSVCGLGQGDLFWERTHRNTLLISARICGFPIAAAAHFTVLPPQTAP